MLPGRFPNLLVNGASGIAVGLATNIPPHNLGEAIDAVVAFIDNPRISFNEILKYIPAPDFPTGGYIIANELNQAYRTGRGRITLRAKLRVEEGENDSKKNIVITELPYQVNKANLLRRIAELREEKKEDFEGITKVSDESDRSGMRAVIEVRSDSDISRIIKLLYKNTDLEVTFGMNMVAIAKGKPVQLGLLDIIRHYVEHQKDVVLKRTRFDLNQAKERCHILEGLIIAVRNIDEVIKIIKKAESTSDAREKLKARFDLSERQAQAILDLRLARLTKLEIFKLEEELKNLKALIEKLTAIVNSARLLCNVIKEELLEIKKKYKVPRRSTFVFSEEEAEAERADVRTPGIQSLMCITTDGKIKSVSEKNFNMSNKTVGEKTKKSTIAAKCQKMLSDEPAFIFTDLGNCYKLYPDDVVRKYNEDGYTLASLFEDASKHETPVAIVNAKSEEGNLLFITKNGMLKKTAVSEYFTGKNSFPAIRLNEGDRVLNVQRDEEDDAETVFFVTKKGMCLNARKDDIPSQGRISLGVKGINLNAGDEVVFASQIDGEGEIVVAISGGRFKRVIAAQIDSLPRYRKGVQIASLKGETILFADYVTVPYMLAIETESGMTEISTEDIAIDATSTRGKPVRGAKWTPKKIYAMKYREVKD